MIDHLQVLSDTAFILLSSAIFTAIGLPLCLSLRGVRHALIIAPIVGYGLAGAAATLLYVAGLTMKTIFLMLVATASISVMVVLLRRLSGRKGNVTWTADSEAKRELLVVLLGWAAATIMLILPAWTGGLQFTCFRGNIHDQFTYLSAATSYAHQPPARVLNAGMRDFLTDPLLIQGKDTIRMRPAVVCLFACLGQMIPSQLYRLHYAYVALLLSTSVLSLSFLALNIDDAPWLGNTIFAALASLATTVGFWGQYVIDISAWSQIGALPLLSCVVALVVAKLGDSSRQGSGSPGSTSGGARPGTPTKRPARAAYFAVTAALVFGSVYFYPEELSLVLGSLLISATVTRLVGYKLHNAALVSAAMLAGVATSLIWWRGTFGFAANEIAHRGAVNWWQHFDKFYFGHCWPYSHPTEFTLATMVDGLAGLFGVYFLTPYSSFGEAAKFLVHALLGLWFIGLIGYATRAFVAGRNQKLAMVVLTIICMAAVSAALCFAGRFWTAGKVVSYAAPYLILLACLPLLSKKQSARFPDVLPALLLISIQILFGAYRPVAAATPTGIHYDAAFYPSIQDVDFKRKVNWRIDELNRDLSGCSSIKIDIANALKSYWAMVYLASKGKTYYATGSVRKHFECGQVLGQAIVPPGQHCVLSLENMEGTISGGSDPMQKFLLRHAH